MVRCSQWLLVDARSNTHTLCSSLSLGALFGGGGGAGPSVFMMERRSILGEIEDRVTVLQFGRNQQSQRANIELKASKRQKK